MPIDILNDPDDPNSGLRSSETIADALVDWIVAESKDAQDVYDLLDYQVTHGITPINNPADPNQPPLNPNQPGLLQPAWDAIKQFFRDNLSVKNIPIIIAAHD